jgi:hypothetical protein
MQVGSFFQPLSNLLLNCLVDENKEREEAEAAAFEASQIGALGQIPLHAPTKKKLAGKV